MSYLQESCHFTGEGADEEQEWGRDRVVEKHTDPRKVCKMSCEITGEQRSESQRVVCSQGCSFIFILQTRLLISPEGSPFPPHTPNPTWNHRARKLGSDPQTNTFTSKAFHLPLCKVKMFKTHFQPVQTLMMMCAQDVWGLIRQV